ncbi:hypothetical protein K438DRAFT_1851415 [Mycena galopus ATCC 62051]|nr:hypothetical protein K438DRAFT_1880689 [Mycena galopus ATCC 62051]KAF8160089.1 hypothetical protein K438DRAFT_1860162 [Mycena galopus ATCC 62051]KAF8172601.1 hypothetical protein K438DRAFT_1851415 [Mycena galopus ATCC 62051]
MGGIFLLDLFSSLHNAAPVVVVAPPLSRAFRGRPRLRAQGPHEFVQERYVRLLSCLASPPFLVCLLTCHHPLPPLY